MRFLFMKVTGNCLAGVASVLFDVNGEHIVSGLNGILRLQTEAVMDMASYLCPAGKQSQK